MQKEGTNWQLSLISDWSAEMFILYIYIYWGGELFTLWNYIYNRKNCKIIVLIQIKLQTFIQLIKTNFFINWVAITQMVLRPLIGLLVTACGAQWHFFLEFCRGFLWDYVARFKLEVPHPFRPLCILSYLCCLPRLSPAYKADLLWLLHVKVSGLEAHLHNSRFSSEHEGKMSSDINYSTGGADIWLHHNDHYVYFLMHLEFMCWGIEEKYVYW